jgi:alcohol dehydrogenase (cytochrome c)
MSFSLSFDWKGASSAAFSAAAFPLACCIATFLFAPHPVGAEDLVKMSQDDTQWIMPAGNYSLTRYSDLDQITPQNAADLQVAWTFSTGLKSGHEAAPLIVGDTMYIVSPWPNILYALNVADGTLKWQYRPDTAHAAQGVACCDVVNRGAAYYDGKIYYNTLDDHTIAVDAKTGKPVWNTTVGSIDRGETMTMAPLVVKGKVLVGNSGGELGIRGWLTALDAKTGKIAWRAYNTGPDKDILLAPDFHPYYKKDQGKDLGVKTWPPGHWKIGGAPVWGWIAYDPKRNLIYYGTGNPGPWNATQRPGDNKWSVTLFARNPDNGEAEWAYQIEEHDLYDYDGINESILATLLLNGKERDVLIRPERNGYIYVIDRDTGEVISADPFEYVTTTKGVDLKTGKLQMVPEMTPQQGKVLNNICPAAPGGKDWQPSAFSPKTGLLYVPHQHLCMDMKPVETGYIAGTPYIGAEVQMFAGPGGYRGEFMAWDPVKRKKVWAIHEEFPVWSGTVVTAGGIAFYGTLDRWFKAVDIATGKVVWKFRTGSGIVGQPVTYKGPDGRQYVAILAGVGGWPGALVSAHLDPKIPFGALGFVGGVSDLPKVTNPGGILYVFALPKKAGGGQ